MSRCLKLYVYISLIFIIIFSLPDLVQNEEKPVKRPLSHNDYDSWKSIYSHVPGDINRQPLLTGKGNYKNWEFNKKVTHLAFLCDRDDYESKESTFNLYGWKVGESKANLWISHTTTTGFPESMAVSNKSSLSFSEDGKVLLFGIKELPDTTQKADVDKEQAKFDFGTGTILIPSLNRRKWKKECGITPGNRFILPIARSLLN